MPKTALITGASSGIGQGTAIRLAREGWHILAHGRDEDRLQQTVAAIQAAGGSATCFFAEMGDMDELANLADWALGQPRLDAFVHCAAKFTYGKVSTERFADWDQSIDDVLRATIRLTAYVLPALQKTQGSVVYICGPTSWLGWSRHAIHCALRHAQAGFAKALFEDVREDGIGVTVVHPGFVNTSRDGYEGKDPAKMIQVEDIAQAIYGAISLPNTACVTEITLRPQRNPYV
ncbi:SDR family NAD(P)-dependent oxidoreductase [Cognatishimia maritima]|uniref:NADP-dependent 3-hydroxy acid dehydrogenase YdfG n=1 Tax=Cognatishimia maritima TaxID=870908 RepID=A0A1M5K7R6_9RHOB|nr:SDR family oxidoreductase [Cognatishimia maritima]SHG48845.1 NADP-dependent 3-hydroxy acid dehydrogenase YdfG [Cognatishimia maritima]